MKNSKDFPIRSDIEKLSEFTVALVEVSKKHGLDVWLCYGGLLGMIRDGGLLPWNNDIQICCWHEHGIQWKFKKIVDDLNRMGLNAFYYGAIGGVTIKAKGVHINLACFYREGGCAVRPHETPSSEKLGDNSIAKLFYWCAIFSSAYPSVFPYINFSPIDKRCLLKSILITILNITPRPLRKYQIGLFIRLSKLFGAKFTKTAIPEEYFDSLTEIKFYGGKILVPKDGVNLLRLIYGEHWMIPMDDWSFYDDSNKRVSGIKFIDEEFQHRVDEII